MNEKKTSTNQTGKMQQFLRFCIVGAFATALDAGLDHPRTARGAVPASVYIGLDRGMQAESGAGRVESRDAGF